MAWKTPTAGALADPQRATSKKRGALTLRHAAGHLKVLTVHQREKRHRRHRRWNQVWRDKNDQLGALVANPGSTLDGLRDPSPTRPGLYTARPAQRIPHATFPSRRGGDWRATTPGGARTHGRGRAGPDRSDFAVWRGRQLQQRKIMAAQKRAAGSRHQHVISAGRPRLPRPLLGLRWGGRRDGDRIGNAA